MGYYLRFVCFLCLLLMGLALAGLGIRHYGLSRPVSNHQTALIQKLVREKKPLIWKADLLSPYGFLKAGYNGRHWFAFQRGKKRELESILQRDRSRALLIHVHLDSSQALSSLRKILNKEERWRKILICSRADGILKDLRELEPRWSFCNGEVFMTRILGLASLRLESLVSIRSDVFFIHLKNLSLNPGLIPLMKEAKRQKKLVFVGPVTGPLQNYPVDAWVVEDAHQ